jgi:acyl-CoA reductase-like NAD-dependent aldehyde dehydrogenase
MKAITKHYIDGAFVESHGRKVMESINPTNQQALGSVMLGDEEDARRAIAAANRAFPMYSRTTKKVRSEILRRMHEVTSARIGDLTGTRLLVPKSRLDEVKRTIVDAMRAFTVGDPADPKTAVGPMVSEKQYERVQSYIRKGIEEGAEVLVGGLGHPRGLEHGNFVKPTVFANVSNDMTIAQEEIFGPVLSVIAYDTVDEAVSIANDSKYGLHAFVSGGDIQRARRVAGQILAGRVVINGMRDDPQAPWGGFKHSGLGREYGAFGIEAFLEPRAILE